MKREVLKVNVAGDLAIILGGEAPEEVEEFIAVAGL